MANVLVLKSSINGETSLTNQLINEFLAARQAAGHPDRIREHDLSAMALPTLDGALFAALRGAADPQPAIRAAVALSDQLIAELKASDLLVIGAPMGRAGVGGCCLLEAAGGADDRRPDALHPPLRPALGVAKGVPGPRHEVEPFF